jgi:quinol monooxygenase YgiN
MPASQNQIDKLRADVNKMLDGLNPDTPIGSTVGLSVQKDKEADFEKLAEALTTATLKLPGCREFGFHEDIPIQPDPTSATQVKHLIYEDWDSVRQFRVQWNSKHLIDFKHAAFGMLAAQPDLKFHGGFEDGQPVPVLSTGQKHCWDSNGDAITSCKDTGQDGEVREGVPSPEPRFTPNNDGTVTDNLTGLIWMQNANVFGQVPQSRALELASKLADGAYGLSDGSAPGDWRLPNVNEFQSLLELDNLTGSALPPAHPFMNATPANYWSSSSVAAAPPLGWYCALAVGPPVFDLKSNSMRMWPVRGSSLRVAKTGQNKCFDPRTGDFIPCAGTGQDGELQKGVPWPDPRFDDNGDGTVTDNLTGLVWLKNAGQFDPLSWEEALKACNTFASPSPGLSDGSKAGAWRLPNLFELRSLMDYSKHSPALPEGHPFLNVRNSLYWSSTTVASAPNLARFVFVGIGPSVWDHKSVELNVWPVRGGGDGGPRTN